jgi:2-hydroxychromene-2-carboxylate isomerase
VRGTPKRHDDLGDRRAYGYGAEVAITSVDFHFDIICPYAYQTSLWMREVRDQLDLDVRWRFFSLEEINRSDGKKHPWERQWSYGWSMMRVAAVLRRIDPDLVDQWYQVAGSALHVEGRKPHRREVAERIVAEMGLDPALVQLAIEDPTTNHEVKAEHDRIIALGGWGVPTLVFDDSNALFGPVLIEPPTGPAALRLWELLTSWLEFPHLYEIQRPKGREDLRAIGAVFRPYLEARDWQSIQKETP